MNYISLKTCNNLVLLSKWTYNLLLNKTLWGRGGQTAAREPHAKVRRAACGSLGFPKDYIFVFYFLFPLQSVEIL